MASGKHRGQQVGCDDTWDTHLTPALGHDGTRGAALQLPKDPRLQSYQAGT